jgi:hypothetical protein
MYVGADIIRPFLCRLCRFLPFFTVFLPFLTVFFAVFEPFFALLYRLLPFCCYFLVS